METIFKIIIYICMAFMPLMVQCTTHNVINHEQTKKLLNGMAIQNAKIDKVFRPSIDGFLGQGATGLIYKGILNGMEVAMKFISSDFQVKALNEVNTYIALGAWNDTKVQNEKFQCEAYGIPTLYHFGTWKNYYILAITLLDLEFERTRKAGQLTAIDKLIVFREMVKISKFIHSRGICHGDLHMNNMMFRTNKAFIIDYNLAINVRDNYEAAKTCAIKDWKKFLADVASTCGITIDYNSRKNPAKIFRDVKPDELKKVFIEFTEAIYDGETLEYDRMYKVINEEIEKANGHTGAVVSWISNEDLPNAKLSATSSNNEPSIESIEFQTYL